MNKNIFLNIFLFLLFLLFFKVDYRVEEPNIYGTSDDSSYFFHAKTLADDFDLDYSNQVSQNNNLDLFYNIERKMFVPRHPFGTGLLSSPFLYFGTKIEKIFGINSFSYFLYSISSGFYFWLSFWFLSKVLYKSEDFKKKNLVLILFGSGILYYVTERFSMTHSYELFSISLILYLSFCLLKYYSVLNNRRKNTLLLITGFLAVFFLTIRWTNYFLLLVPLIYFEFMNKRKLFFNLFIKNKSYLLGIFLGIITFLIHTKIIYGLYTLFPTSVYDSESTFYKIQQMFKGSSKVELINFLSINSTNFTKLLFTFEFGLFFVSPILFYLLLFPLKLLLHREWFKFTIISLTIFLPLANVLIWQTTASSFGFRYLFSLIPIGVFLFFQTNNSRIVKFIVTTMSIFSLVCLLFFETNNLTILTNQINTFGIYHEYSAPKFVIGVIISIFSLSSYLKIFFTSYLGVLFLKILYFINLDNLFFELVEKKGYFNVQVENLYIYSKNFNFLNYLIFFIIFYLIKKTYKDTDNSS